MQVAKILPYSYFLWEDRERERSGSGTEQYSTYALCIIIVRWAHFGPFWFLGSNLCGLMRLGLLCDTSFVISPKTMDDFW
ncbi:hypothetical protein HanIR_Chr01g0024621 [Helianthus annuus]|nr:hypothetical protein HanIR_Chr01g0024621 [Helianthus annuus]